MSQNNDLYAVKFEQLCSGADAWSMRLVDHSTQTPLHEQTCLPSELSKLLLFSGSTMMDCVQHQNQLYSLREVQMHPVSKHITLWVAPCQPGTNTHLILTPAQQIIADQLPAQLRSPTAQVLAFIKLNDHLFSADPTRLIFLVGESQYDEYDYLAALVLSGLQKGLHPEYVFRTLFDKVGLGGRYSNDAIYTCIDALEAILRKVHEPSPLTDTLLDQRPNVFTCSALLQPALLHLAPSSDEEPSGIWNETIALSECLLEGDSVERAVRKVFKDSNETLNEMEGEDLAYLMETIRQIAAKASVLCNTRTYKAILNPRADATSRFDTGLNDLTF